jgi:hypothetical protein
MSFAGRREEPRGTRRGAAARAARRGAWTLARLVNLVAGVVATIVVLGILLVVLEANRSNDIVNAALDAARWLAGPFKDLFTLDNHKTEVAVNYGIAAVVYLAVGGLIARLLRR